MFFTVAGLRYLYDYLVLNSIVLPEYCVLFVCVFVCVLLFDSVSLTPFVRAP